MNLKQKSIFQTNLGGVGSIFLTLICAAALVLFSYDLFAKEKPTSSTSQAFVENAEINGNDFFFAVAIMDYLENPVTNLSTKFNLVLEMDVFNQTLPEQLQWNTTDYSLIPCSENNYVQNNTLNVTTLFRVPVASYYCMPNGFKMDVIGDTNSVYAVLNQLILS
jgi:hypothetical protein